MRVTRLAAAVTGPRGRWVTVGVWLVLGVAGLLARTQIGEVTSAGQSSFLPANAESTRAVDLLQRDFKGGADVPVLIVFERNGGLTGADLNAIGRLGSGLERLGLAGATPVLAPFSGEAKQPLGDVARIARGVGPISRDGEAALIARGDRRRRSRRRGRGSREDPRLPRRTPACRPAAPTSPAPAGWPPTSSGSPTTPAARSCRDPGPGPAPAAVRLPGAGPGAAAAARRRHRLPDRDRHRLPADPGWGDHGQRRGHDAAAGPHLRRRHGLLAAADPPLPRGARGWPGAGRGAASRACRERAADRRLGRDGDRGDAGAAARRPRVDPLARPGPGDRHRRDARRGPDPAAGRPLAARPAGLLAGGARLVGAGGEATPLGPGRAPGPPPPAHDRRRRLRRAARPLARQPRRPRHDRLRPGGNPLDRIQPRQRSPRRTLPAGRWARR